MAADAAEPTLASALFAVPSDRNDINETATRQRPRFVGTECAAVDHVLQEGLGYGDGGVCCISGDPGSGIDELTRCLLVSHLISYQSSSATIIDARGAFDVIRLHQALVARLEASESNLNPRDNEAAGIGAAQMLDRVRIMRVFDVDGLLEGIGEMRQHLEAQRQRGQERRRGPEEGVDVDEEEVAMAVDVVHVRSTIADSQDGEEEMLDDLLDARAPDAHTTATTADTGATIAAIYPQNQDDAYTKDDVKEDETGHMLIIDNLSALVGPVIKNNYIQGQALLTSFLRSLRHTSRQEDMCTLVLNSTLTYKDDQEAPSAFSSTVSRPELGKTLGYMVDTHLFVSRLVKTQADVQAALTRQGKETQNGWGGSARLGQWVSALEVLQDRDGDRVGKVGLFVVDDDDGLIKDAF